MRPSLFVAGLAVLALLTAALARWKLGPPQEKAAAQADAAAAARLVTTSPEPLPAWTRRKPEIVVESGRRVAHAVASARAGDLGLSRTAAEDRARYELAKLIDGRAAIAGSQVVVTGASVVQTYSAADGTVYVELAAPVSR